MLITREGSIQPLSRTGTKLKHAVIRRIRPDSYLICSLFLSGYCRQEIDRSRVKEVEAEKQLEVEVRDV